MFSAGEPPTKIGIEGITAAKPYEPSMAAVQEWVQALQDAERTQDHDGIRRILQGAIPEFREEQASVPNQKVASPSG